MRLDVARPVRREATWATALAQLHRAFEMTEFDTEARQSCEGVDDEPTAVAGVVIALVGIWFYLNRAVDADGVGDPLVFAPGMRLANFGAGWRVTERTPGERLLYHWLSASASRPAVQPRWKTANCVAESKLVSLGS